MCSISILSPHPARLHGSSRMLDIKVALGDKEEQVNNTTTQATSKLHKIMTTLTIPPNQDLTASE